MKRLLILFLSLLAFAFLLTLAGVLASSSSSVAKTGGGPVVLLWRLDRPLLERSASSIALLGDDHDSMGAIYPALRAARSDADVRGVALYIQDVLFGLAKVQEISQQLAALRAAGKAVDCYLESAGEGGNGTLGYLLASACQTIALAPAADVNLLGLAAEGLFLRGTLDKLGIEPNFLHVGRYKSAAETFTERENSPAAEEALATVLDEYYEQIVAAIAQGRRKTPAVVRSWIDGGPYTADEALRLGLVDSLAYPDEFRAQLDSKAGSKGHLRDLRDYSVPSFDSSNRVAIAFAAGDIVRGGGGSSPWSEQTTLGSDDMAVLLRSLADDDSIAAVVLRIDSPGGSALASDLILREVELLRRKKPVVVSMSDLAASGGYYIAAKASKIVAEPATLTGSIGVVGGKFVTRSLLEDKLGMSHDSLKRGANADLYSSLNPYTPEQEARLQALMNRIYQTFVGHVANGRRLERRRVEDIAEGRVWTGQSARRLGLVDELGGLDKAIEIAQKEAHLDGPPTLEFHPEPPSWLDLFRERAGPLVPASLARPLALARELESGSIPRLALGEPFVALARGPSH